MDTPESVPPQEGRPPKRVRLEQLHVSGEQAILNFMKKAYETEMQQPDFHQRLRLIKEHFVARNYKMVFRPENLPIYLINYLPSRALTYFNLFTTEPFLFKLIQTPNLEVCCLGGGPGSELLGLAAASLTTRKRVSIQINTHDNADWSTATQPLLENLQSQWNISPSIINPKLFLSDILEPTEQLLAHLGSANLITLMFTVNELFTQKDKAMKFISTVQQKMKPGSFLLILDSAGDFSEIEIGKKKYMIYQIFDFLQGFKSIVSTDSKWYRFPEGLNYPLKLNSQRYFLRLYRREQNK